MKQLLIFILLATAFVGCAKDDDEQTQDYTSFTIMQNEISVQPNTVIGYYTTDGKCKKLVELGDLAKGVASNETIVNIDTLKYIYVFMSTEHVATKLDTVFILKKNIKNTFRLLKNTKGTLVSRNNDTQFPH